MIEIIKQIFLKQIKVRRTGRFFGPVKIANIDNISEKLKKWVVEYSTN